VNLKALVQAALILYIVFGSHPLAHHVLVGGFLVARSIRMGVMRGIILQGMENGACIMAVFCSLHKVLDLHGERVTLTERR